MTVDPGLRSFVPVAEDSHFPIQNLPYGVGMPAGGGEPRVLTAIGDYVLDLSVLEKAGFFADSPLLVEGIFSTPYLNSFMALGRAAWRETRATLVRLLREDEPTLRDDGKLRARALSHAGDFEMLLPAFIGDFTGFYSSRTCATNMGALLRGQENALMPNWLHLPVACHGRSSSIVQSGIDLLRPSGQMSENDRLAPTFGPSKQVDFELEAGFFVGPASDLGRPVAVREAEDHIFGMVLVNDWSARDIQKWEYQPLGPFLAKNFGTSISPWVVTMDALEPFRCEGPPQDPEPMPYLTSSGPQTFDIRLEAFLTPVEGEGKRICVTNFKHLYWNMSQQIAHHTATGCNLTPGDLMSSGTVSGPSEESYGSLLELTWRGDRPIVLPDGEERRFLEDGDRITLTGWCQGDGHRIGFGELTGRILASPPAS